MINYTIALYEHVLALVVLYTIWILSHIHALAI